MTKAVTDEEFDKAIRDHLRLEMVRMHQQYNPLMNQANMANTTATGVGLSGRAMFPPAPQENAVHVEYIPVENGYVVNITKNRNELPKVYVAKDLAEAHELVTTYMVKERLSK
jgi:hypothetical protein